MTKSGKTGYGIKTARKNESTVAYAKFDSSSYTEKKFHLFRVVPEDRLGFIDCEHHEVCLSSKGNIGAQGFLLDEQGDHRVAYKTYFFHLLYERWARLDLVWGYSEYPTILWYECDPLSPRDLKE